MKVEAPVRPRAVVVLGVRAKDALQVTSSEDEDVVQALASNGSDPSLRDGVGLGRANGCLHHGEAFSPEDLVEGPRELGIPISNEEALVLETFGDRKVPSLLGDPGRVGRLVVPATWTRLVESSMKNKT